MEYKKIDVCKDNCILFYKEHKNDTKCLKCGKSRFVEVINEDGESVTTDVAHKQVRYMPLTPQLKWLFLSKKTARHMRWHKEGVCENDQVMVHPSDSDAWKITLIQTSPGMRGIFALGWRQMDSCLTIHL
jgi:hypothetical protein